MILVDTKYRTGEEEIMDDFSLRGDALKRTLKDLDKINRWLGGTSITMDGIQEILAGADVKGQVRIVDVGCGNGSMLREIARFGRKKDLMMDLVGIDANPFAIEIAREEAKRFPEISFEHMDVFSEAFDQVHGDIILCTLTLHHFKDEEIQCLLQSVAERTAMGIVINDLQRSRMAYYLFQLFCRVFIDNELARKDGLTSIRRSFRKKDLEAYCRNLELGSRRIRWKWAFRYQCVLTKK